MFQFFNRFCVRNRQRGLVTVFNPSLTVTYHSYSALGRSPAQRKAVVDPEAKLTPVPSRPKPLFSMLYESLNWLAGISS